MSFLTRILPFLDRDAPDGPRAPSPADRLAAAALLVHVARVDGRFSESERHVLCELLAARHGLHPHEAETLVTEAERHDLDVDDVAELVDAVRHGAEDRTGRSLLVLGYAVAASDGGIGEFEDDLLWRLGGLLGFDDDTLATIKAEGTRTGVT